MDRGAWQARVHEVARVRHDLETKIRPPPCIMQLMLLTLLSTHLLPHYKGSLQVGCFEGKVEMADIGRALGPFGEGGAMSICALSRATVTLGALAHGPAAKGLSGLF